MKKSFSLRYRILFSLVGVTSLVMVIISVITFYVAGNLRHDSNDRYFSTQIMNFSNLFELEIANYQHNLKSVTESNQSEISDFFANRDSKGDSGKNLQEEMKFFLSGDREIVTNYFVALPQNGLFAGQEKVNQSLLTQMLKSGANIKPLVLHDALTQNGQPRLILTTPSTNGNAASERGFTGLVINFPKLIEKLETLTADSGIYIQFFDQNDHLIFASDPEFLPFIGQIVKDENGLPFNFEGGIHSAKKGITNIDNWNNRSLYVVSIENTPFRILFSIPDADLKASVTEISNLLIVFNVILFITLIFLAWYNSSKVIRPVTHLTRLIRDTSAGTLKLSDLVDKKQDAEFQELGMAFRDFILSSTSVVDGIKQNGIELSGMTEDINGTLSKFSESASTLSAAVAQTTSAMEEMAASSRNISATTGSVVAIARQSQTRALDGLEEFKAFLKKMEEIRAKNDNRSHDIVSLGKKAARITEIMTIINHINEQTKLIAFNAALEASGAGEAGKRFSVVANEIRRLAENVQESTEEIKMMISEIQQSTGELMKGTAEANSSIQTGVNQVKEIVNSMNLFVDEAKNTTESAQQISYSTQQQLSAAEEIVTTLHDISLTASQFAEMSTDLANTAERLNSMSVQLVEMSIVSVHK
ncbi:MAG: methyl-accepting chemotaxis protein [Bacteroidetes bacterium]|nr:methyl-accepting chemotaxis protein [Bacteroidota bacterium]